MTRAGAARWTEWGPRLSLATAFLSPVGDRLDTWAARVAEEQGWDFIPPDFPRPILFDLEQEVRRLDTLTLSVDEIPNTSVQPPGSPDRSNATPLYIEASRQLVLSKESPTPNKAGGGA